MEAPALFPTASPHTIESTGVSKTLLEGLALKILCDEGELWLIDLSQRMRVSFSIIEQLFERMRREQLCEVRGMIAGVHRIAPTVRGETEGLKLLAQNHYVGPAPVSLKDYTRVVRAQSGRNVEIHPPDIVRVFDKLELDPETITQIGTAVVSGRSIFLYGPPGTGKSSVAEAIPGVYGDSIWLPHAIEVEGQAIPIFDSELHVRIDNPPAERDARWVLCKRPRVIAGGELTLEMLDLQFNPLAGMYVAPLQLRANNGVLIIDDFGRQRARPEDLLNRWIVPLDRGRDFLTLVGGKKFEVPFELLVIFRHQPRSGHLDRRSAVAADPQQDQGRLRQSRAIPRDF